jgi:hypothetical protein
VISDAVPAEATVAGDLVRSLSLHEPVPEWASTILATRNTRRSAESLERVRNSAFSIERSTASLTAIYGLR